MEGPDASGHLQPARRADRRVYERHITALADSNALDFDDLLLKTVELFESSAETRERYARKFRYVMVDEYQDTNRPQYLRSSGWPKSTATWPLSATRISRSTNGAARTCAISSISSTTSRRRNVVRLEQNYRSTQVILDAATAVIQQNRNRKDKRLWTDRKGGRKIAYFRGADELEEADFITRSIKQARPKTSTACRGALPHQRAVASHRRLADARGGGVQGHRRRAILRAKEIKDALAYLKL